MSEIAEGLDKIRARVAAACSAAGRESDEVAVIAVSKRHPVEVVREAFAAGQAIFGESRVQELLAKVEEVPTGVRWHFIGHLQKNKIRRLLPCAELLHGVDSLDLAESIDRIADEEGWRPRVLLEVNVSGESSKHGFAPDDLRRDLDALLGLGRLEIEGLMTLAPYAEDAEAARPYFRALRELRDEIAAETGLPFGTLSMGMSGDYEVAISEGATMVRVGTAIFGERPTAK
ncbi:MAG: YggS family pyridoxal phosphate-dependent enzyme [Chthoniobacterales bacterium]